MPWPCRWPRSSPASGTSSSATSTRAAARSSRPAPSRPTTTTTTPGCRDDRVPRGVHARAPPARHRRGSGGRGTRAARAGRGRRGLMATVDTSTVTLSINGREITVPKGLSLVEAAAEAGIEVPVFCYEPRVGPAVGACRMCLVEIEGMPKLQTACTTPAGDGMVVHSTSDRAREGQDAVLEFLLLNHPLDCPVCDKGGECPLQDLTFRYGPSVTRMTVPKRTHDKPVVISPLIKLDRERCILCYRCTRFSEDVSGDLQLVAEHRGANSQIG